MNDLVRWGFAPGNYTCKCSECKNHYDGEKRSSTCESCATKLRDGDKPYKDALALLQAHDGKRFLAVAAMLRSMALPDLKLMTDLCIGLERTAHRETHFKLLEAIKEDPMEKRYTI